MRKFILINIIILLSISGCVSIGTLGEKEHNNKVFSGTIRHIELACGHGICLDFPFSFVTDAVLLPVTIPWSIYNVSTGRAEKYKEYQKSINDDVPELLKKNNVE
ncbi:YceK/YidQ family lipoprotein [uncultured Psychrosphaera sp.]|jgi:uncharacterized protein YceK|uniref:YceK/YidQ family lipoprotein n=1 Tax=uncultured Psychrosphaera sp. TaxID=1403522 RepID=UPI002622CE38|nr:YceK/YidQ family lipoprotein [uncultured Psychrosphaera sp.]